jgi:hypothetical protein
MNYVDAFFINHASGVAQVELSDEPIAGLNILIGGFATQQLNQLVPTKEA